ncbi:lipid-A-disaccharide synthase-related protein [Pleurocapsa sp. PCC 7319]|uniref:lipid-A-disaccharide synthase-related protein n=1 Tax=Pleurocapsa sp. PCC 7319 TaxID=118161 RepID=UPI00034ACF4A|nr:lipid-A-disaccharide synthase-related protein [Pleurocapsa sp. PCC 7319]
MKLLVLSNGHGEDEIAVRIIEQLQIVTHKLEIVALPIVGQGYAYSKLNIPIAGRVQQMPSGGFIYMGGNPLWSDIRGGLIQLTIEQLKLVRHWGQENTVILAVGDIVPLLYAWLSKANYAFVGTAKSEYYLRNETEWLAQTSWLEKKLGSVYLPWERWLMSRSACKAAFPRDSLTTEILQKWSIPAYDLGNPMMDGITANSQFSQPEQLNVLLLPGSRMPEALKNWQQILTSLPEIIKSFPQEKLNFGGAIAPALNLQAFIEEADIQGWQITAEQPQTRTLTKDQSSLILSQNSYQRFLQQADIAIAMAGTATEQFVGLGKPAIIMPGEGPQFTYAFAEAQSRLLGCSIMMVESPEQVAKAIAQVINNPQLLAQIALNGKRRMGEAGAAQRIAQCLQQTLLK